MMGSANNQSPVCGAKDARNEAHRNGETGLHQVLSAIIPATVSEWLFHWQSICAEAKPIAALKTGIVRTVKCDKRSFWRESALAAAVKKARSASEDTRLTPVRCP